MPHPTMVNIKVQKGLLLCSIQVNPDVGGNQMLVAPFPSARNSERSGQTYKAALCVREEQRSINRSGTWRLLFTRAVCKTWYCTMWVFWPTWNCCLRTRVDPHATEVDCPCPAVAAAEEGDKGHSSHPLRSSLPGTALCVHEASPSLLGTGWYRETKRPKRACQESNNQPFKSCSIAVSSSTLLLQLGFGTLQCKPSEPPLLCEILGGNGTKHLL